jgi:soluble lytic murein transglycosylase
MKTLLVFVAVGLCAAAPVDSGVARLGQAITAYEKKDFAAAARLLSESGQPAKLRDYVAYYLANAELVTGNGEAALHDLSHYSENPVPNSPLGGKIQLLYAKALMGQPNAATAANAKAREILQNNYALLPQPDGDFALGQTFEATGFPKEAVVNYQRVYFLAPASDLSEKARIALDRLETSMGKDYPEAPGRERLQRADALLSAKQYPKARAEYAMLAAELTGADREVAESGVGAALFLDGDAAGSANYLSPLKPEDAEAAAKRLYYLTEDYRKLNDDSSMLDSVHQLGDRYPVSPWRLKALIAAGNQFLMTQDRAQYVPLFRAAAESFPGDNAAAGCEWHVVWAAWLDRSPQRVALLKEQVEKFPNDTHVSDALFFLARAAEDASDHAAARAYYERLSIRFPHYYYAGVARTKLTEAKFVAAKPDPAVRSWLEEVTDPDVTAATPTDIAAIPNDATRQRIERGRLLIAAGMTTAAVQELEFGAKQANEQATILAMELSRSMPTPYLAMRVMKRFGGDYLSLPYEKATRPFWEMLFPLPYEESVKTNAVAHDLDPYAVAGLIRQESEFNPTAKSPYAYGLMQVRPTTGKSMGKSEGIKVVGTSSLYNPDTNIKLGTEYLKTELSHWDGDWIKTLAAYNAGPGRVRQWVDQYGDTDPAEFLENIPFDETRNYVQAVLRNQQVYRELYGTSKVTLASAPADTAEVPPAKIANIPVATRVVATHPGRISLSKKAAAARKATARSKSTAHPSAVSSNAKSTAKKPAGKGSSSAKKSTTSSVTTKHAAA